MIDMQQHIRELKDMRRVAREEGITNASLAEYLKVPESAIFFIMTGKTQKGELRERVYKLLATNEVAAAWNKPLIVPRPLEDQAPVKPVEAVEPSAPAKVELPIGHTAAEAMRAAWQKLGVSQGELAARFNRTAGSINPVLVGHVTKGPLYDALREHLLEGKPAKCFESWQRANKGDPGNPPLERKPAVAPVKLSDAEQRAIRQDYGLAPRPVVVSMPVQLGDEDALMAQASAAEELAEALKDLALLRQAERRYNTAVAIARAAGLHVGSPAEQSRAA